MVNKWVTVGLGIVFAYALAIKQMIDPEPGLAEVVSRYYDKDFLDKAAHFHHQRLVLFFAQTGVVFGCVLFLSSRWGFKIARIIKAACRNRLWLARLGIISLIFLSISAVRLPFTLAHFYLAHDYGLRQDRLSAFLLDWMTMKLIAWFIISVSMLALLALFVRFSRWWWVASGLALGVFAGCYILATPLVIDPIFNKFEKLDNPRLSQRLTGLMNSSGVDVQNIWVADASRRTKRANAYFTGFWGAQRIVLYDTLLDNYNIDEIVNVVAHELAHWQQKHILKGLLIGVIGLLTGLFILHQILTWMLKNRFRQVSREADPVLVLPVYLFYIVSMYLVMPPANWVSRQMEKEADQLALELTLDTNTFIQTSVKLAQQNLSEVSPAPWVEAIFFTHPSNSRRIMSAERFRGTQPRGEKFSFRHGHER